MCELIDRASQLSEGYEPVLVLGGPGSGKKTLARAIHAGKTLNPALVVTVKCGTLTADNLSSVVADRSGVPETELPDADTNSALILSHIEDLNPVVQERLLEAIETGAFSGSDGTAHKICCRIFATANEDKLMMLVNRGYFSPALFKALNVNSLRMPGLSERIEDIPWLVAELLHGFSLREGIETPSVPYHYMELLTRVAWPENIRQLKNHLESVMVLSDGEFTPEIISQHFTTVEGEATVAGLVHSLREKIFGQKVQPGLVQSR